MAGFLPEHLPNLRPNIGESPRPVYSRLSCRPTSIALEHDSPTTLVKSSRKHNTLVERRSMVFKLKSAHKYDEAGKAKHRICRVRGRQFFRCDIHATSSSDESSALKECKQLVTEAGGAMVNDFEYLGGFLFEMPPGVAPPIETGDLTAKGGDILVTPWQPFPSSETLPRPEEKPGFGCTGRIDDFFHRKVKVRSETECQDEPRGWNKEDLTLMEMLMEGRLDHRKRDEDDLADWETLFEGSDGESLFSQ